jgi:hypothetical protein
MRQPVRSTGGIRLELRLVVLVRASVRECVPGIVPRAREVGRNLRASTEPDNEPAVVPLVHSY